MAEHRRTAIVTGASRGIGRGIAEALGTLGFNVVVNYHASAEAAQEVVAAVCQAGGQAVAVQADIASLDDHAKLLDATHRAFGKVDLLVNNAGVAPKARLDLMETTPESYDRLLDTNLRGPFFLTQRIAADMIAKRAQYPVGHRPAVVNITSISAYTVSVNRGEYCLSKAGLSMMTQLFAARLAEHEIHVHEIRPGVIATDMTGPVKEKYDKLIAEGLFPLRRWGQPADVAAAVVAIAQGHLDYSTGQVIDVDGGFHISRL